MTFSGVYAVNVDAKGRVVVPAPFREALGEPFVLTRDGETLLLLPLHTWDRLERQAPRETRAWAAEVTPDLTTGRILIPAKLRAGLGLHPGREVTFAGCGSVVAAGLQQPGTEDLPQAPAWVPRENRASRLVTVDRGTVLLALDLLATVKGRTAEVLAVVGELARRCG